MFSNFCTVSDIQLDDFDIITILNKTLYTTSAKFDIEGNVTLTPLATVSQNRRSFNVHGLLFGGGGCALNPHFHHHGHNFQSVLSNVINGFSYSCNFFMGHSHNTHNPWYFFTSHGHSYYSPGASFHYHDKIFYMHVHVGHKHFHLRGHFTLNFGVHYHIACSFR